MHSSKSAKHSPASNNLTGDMKSNATRAAEKGVSESTSDVNHVLLSLATYNCEGLMSALPFVGSLLLVQDVIFLAETWTSRSEERYLPSYINDCCSVDCFVVQEFAMDFPPGAGVGMAAWQWSAAIALAFVMTRYNVTITAFVASQ